MFKQIEKTVLQLSNYKALYVGLIDLVHTCTRNVYIVRNNKKQLLYGSSKNVSNSHAVSIFGVYYLIYITTRH